jgi:CheY-like chemotaxis protein
MKLRKILLVEDNEGDILLTREALEHSEKLRQIDVVKNGSEALKYLEMNSGKDAAIPDLIFLDINLPKMNGQEVLQFIKKNEQLKYIPVIMLTTSSSHKDILSSYMNGANSYITKPVDVNAYMDTISKVVDYWYEISKLPSK